MKKTLHYSCGVIIKKGDIVSVFDKRGIVEDVVYANTLLAKDLSCFESGGILLKFEDGDMQLWPYVNEDLVYISRAGDSIVRHDPET